MKNSDKGRAAAMACAEGGFEALQSMLKGEYTEESTGARTIRQTGGKDRHSKVFTARGPRDRRVRLSVATAIRFYDLQDRLGFEQPSKAVEWLLLNCQASIQGLPHLASLHPVRIASALSTQPAPATDVAHNPKRRQEPCKDEHKSSTHPQKEEILDAAMHPASGEQNFHHYDYPTHHPYSLQSGLFPLSCDDPLQDSLEEDLSQYSIPSSSGGSSDHPISFPEAARPAGTSQSRATLAEAIPTPANHMASSASMYGQCSTSIAPSPDRQPTVHMSKRPRMQQCVQNQGGTSRFASSGDMMGKSLIGMKNGLSSELRCSGFSDPPGFNRLVIGGDEDTFLMSKFSLQRQLQINEDHMQQQVMKLTNYKTAQYVDNLLAAQASELAESMILQGAACNDQSSRGADQYSILKGQVCTSNTSNIMNDHMQLYDNKMAFNQQQVEDQLVCSNLYASPSPSESTSINPLAAAYSKAAAGAGSNNNTNHTMLDDQKQLAAAALNILFRPSWNPAPGLQ